MATLPLRHPNLTPQSDIKDTAERPLATFTGKAVLNNTEGTAPTLTSATATGITVELDFSENLDPDSLPSSNVFSIDVADESDDPSIYDYTLKDDKITLKLATAIKTSDTVTFTYKKPTEDGATVLEDLAGNDVAAITNHAVTNSTVDILVVSKSSMTINEGSSGTFTVKLAAQPARDVTVSFGHDGSIPVGISPSRVEFTTDNWNTTQTVTLTGAYDANDWDDSGDVILLALDDKIPNLGNQLGDASIAVTVTDTMSSETAEVTPDLLRLNEGGSGTFTVSLTSQPTSDVRVRVRRNEEEDGLSVTPAVLQFTSSDYKTPQSFTIRAEQDEDTEDETFWVEIKAEGGSDFYSSHRIVITDTGAGSMIVLSPKAFLNVPEEGTASVQVKLSQAPSGNVTVTPTLGTTPAHGLSMTTTSLTFTTGNFGAWQDVTLAAANDANAVDERAALTFSASGGGYANRTQTIEVVAKENDVPVHLQPPTVMIAGVDKNDVAVTGSPQSIPSDGKIKVTFNKKVGSCSLRTARICPTAVTAWTAISDALRDELFELVRVGHLDDGETRNVSFTASISGNTITITPSGLTGTIYEDEPKRINLLVGDNFWSVVGGVQGKTYLETFKVTGPTAQGSNSPPLQNIWSLVNTDVIVSNVTSRATGCLDVENAETNNGQNVQTWDCNGTAAQTWRLEQRSSGSKLNSFRLVSGLGDGNTYCLDNRGQYGTSDMTGIWTCVDNADGAVANQSFDLTGHGNGWQLKFTRNGNSSVLWSQRPDNEARGNVGQRRNGSGERSAWVIEDASDVPLPPVQGSRPPQPTLSVEDAAVTEGPNAELVFQLNLNRALTSNDELVSVNFATRDGTAIAGTDYTAAEGTISFALGDQHKSISVSVLEDAYDDDNETMELLLSSAVGASIADGAATGTIHNADPVPNAWLARFGRGVAEQVVDAVKNRREASRSPSDMQVSFAGQGFGNREDENWTGDSNSAMRDRRQPRELQAQRNRTAWQQTNPDVEPSWNVYPHRGLSSRRGTGWLRRRTHACNSYDNARCVVEQFVRGNKQTGPSRRRVRGLGSHDGIQFRRFTGHDESKWSNHHDARRR